MTHRQDYDQLERNIWSIYNQRVPKKLRELLCKVADLASTRGRTVYLVGGVLRDMLLGVANFDFDLLVDGDGIPLAEASGIALGGEVTSYAKFHTAKLTLPDGCHLDFASARSEIYAYPAALPIAKHSTVQADLYRRDFTINAMAMALNGDTPGRLLDPFKGSVDLEASIIRILHDESFIDDPTRILRAVRFETRLNFHMEECTEKLAHQAIERKLLDQVSGERIRTELYQLVAQESPSIALQRLNELGFLFALEADWQGDDLAPEYARLQTALAFAQTEPSIDEYFTDSKLLRFLLLFTHFTPEAAERLARRLRLSHHEIALAIASTALPELQHQLECPALLPSEIAARLSRLPHPLFLLLLTQSDSKILWERIKHYLIKQRMQPTLLTGEDLQHLGLPSGAIYTYILRALRAAQLDGKVNTRTEAIAVALKMANEEDLKTSNNQ